MSAQGFARPSVEREIALGHLWRRGSIVQMLRRMGAPALAECIAGLDGLAAEFVPERVDGAFRNRPLARPFVNQIGRIGPTVVGQVADTDAEEAVARAVCFFLQKLKAGLENAVGQPRRIGKLAVARAQLEVLGLQLENNSTA